MAQNRPLPRICIALGLPDVPTLLDHARREAEAGEMFLEFRLDYLDQPAARRAPPSAAFLSNSPIASSWPPAAAIRTTADSTAASKSNSPSSNSPLQHGAHAIDVEIETAEAATRHSCNQFRGRAQVIVSYHNFEATPPLGRASSAA